MEMTKENGFGRLNLDRKKVSRNRKVRACEQCRACKIRCDQARPQCENCVSHHRNCVYKSEASDTKASEERRKSGSNEPGRRSTSDSPQPQDQITWANQSGYLTAGLSNQARYFAGSSWVAAVEAVDDTFSEGSPNVKSEPTETHKLSSSATTRLGETFPLSHADEVDRLISWYSQFCHFWYPFVDIPELTGSFSLLKDGASRPDGSPALIAAVCYAAASSVTASKAEPLSIVPGYWKRLAEQLLAFSNYPLQPNLNTIRAAFLLANSSVMEKGLPDPGPISTLVRAAQSVGLHRDPSAFRLSERQIDLRRVLWWSIKSLDVGYSMAHAVPPLIHAASCDVLPIIGQSMDRLMLTSMLRINEIFAKVLDEMYGRHQPTLETFQRLEKEVDEVCDYEAGKTRLFQNNSPQKRFIAMSISLCAQKLIFVLHQPYLRSAQWPVGSREKTLRACHNYIEEFIFCATDPDMLQFKWVTDHFNLIHACAIVLQDLLQYPKDTEARRAELRSLVERSFATCAKESDTQWEKLEVLRCKAWVANQWHAQVENSSEWSEIDACLADWDPLFASYAWDDFLASQ